MQRVPHSPSVNRPTKTHVMQSGGVPCCNEELTEVDGRGCYIAKDRGLNYVHAGGRCDYGTVSSRPRGETDRGDRAEEINAVGGSGNYVTQDRGLNGVHANGWWDHGMVTSRSCGESERGELDGARKVCAGNDKLVGAGGVDSSSVGDGVATVEDIMDKSGVRGVKRWKRQARNHIVTELSSYLGVSSQWKRKGKIET
ncbi:hypothetical protein FH972_019966 [Carpinus fangiana]|uniref:Uncharacterized protein n=1 Tax=Carpinus fangiana TaxID=176857 RepID=A0A5N6RUZ1_9ROSI|nr:hypothetical protein FH972_019966 [Carpinus fangiana]